MNVLVTGGAGYIGGAVARVLRAAGHAVVLVDDLSTGHRDTAEGFDLLCCDFADAALVGPALNERRIEAIVHMAAHCLVGESMQRPAYYYENNVVRSLKLLDLAVGAGVKRWVFSSSAATYGEPERTPIDEDHPTRPTNPYGETKLVFERALGWHALAHGFAAVSLRYFNAAGALPGHGERHDPESHLVPNILAAAETGKPIEVFGTDYPTPDGTAVRDYIHIADLAEAHRLALDAATGPGRARAFNLGNGDGFSVRAVIAAAEAVVGRAIPYAAGPRREGDPPVLVARSTRAT
ncbi:MAG TPA: UDP-glucose 4-epimerase GalE, partial [Candidatus Polarisedimenticolia bacterium]|nr:UDP-glucose 4-epimerase GalE [Candidatus Polarisedimenticolia bacterium]